MEFRRARGIDVVKVICSPPTFVFAQRASTSAMDSVDELTIQVRRKVIKKVNRRSDYCVLGNPIRIDRRVLTIILPDFFTYGSGSRISRSARTLGLLQLR